MGHEDSVYLAKLAEQAERYEGKKSIGLLIIFKQRCLQIWAFPIMPLLLARLANMNTQKWLKT